MYLRRRGYVSCKQSQYRVVSGETKICHMLSQAIDIVGGEIGGELEKLL